MQDVDTSPSTTRRPSSLVQLISCVLLIIVIRFYYEWVVRNTPEFYSWFSESTLRLTMLYLLAVVVSGGTAVLASRWFNAAIVIPAGILGGAATTLAVSSITGGVIGGIVSVYVASSSLRSKTLSAVRSIVRNWLPSVSVGGLAGFLFSLGYFSWDERSRLILIGAGFVILIVGGVITIMWLLRDPNIKGRSLLTRSCFIVTGFVCVALGVWLGPQIDLWRRAQILSRVGNVSWEMKPIRQRWSGMMRIDGVSLHENAEDRHLLVMRGTPDVRWMSISSPKVSDDGGRALAHLKEVQFLTISASALGDPSFENLGPNLASLSIRGASITDQSLKHIAQSPWLRYLQIHGMDIDGDGFHHLAKTITLQGIVLKGVDVTDDDLAALADMPSLVSLTLIDTQVTGSGFHHMAKNPSLKSIDIQDSPLRPKYLADLVPLGLNWLSLSGCEITPEGMDAIRKHPKLITLRLLQTDLTDDDVAKLSGTKLAELELDGRQLTSAINPMVDAAETDIYVADVHVTEDDLDRLVKLRFPVQLQRCTLTPRAAELLSKRPYSVRISPSGVTVVESD